MTVDTSIRAATLGDLLTQRAWEQPEATAFTFMGDDGESSLTYGELDRRARSIGEAIRARAGGERVLILYPPGLDYVAALFACFHAGATAVPAYPPDPVRLERTLARLLAIVRDARPELVLTIAALRDVLEEELRGRSAAPRLTYLATDSQPLTTDGSGPRAAPGGDDLALLQYTSGSTAAPRGVMLTHANLLTNSDFIRRAFGTSPRTRAVVWLPPYHDMGLVGGVLQPVFAGFPCVLMSPLTFLRRPLTWLRALSDHRATASGGPNFAYDLCVRRVTAEEAIGLDLSAWEVAFNGAEPVRRETIDAFSERFGTCGFRREAFYPCYGLAEGTLMITGGTRLRPPRFHELGGPGRRPQSVTGCGRPDRDHRVLIVDPESRAPLAAGCVGEIWVEGPSVARGYWGRPAESEDVFGGQPTGGEGPFLRTGDLGFLLEGELFVTGRIKDLLIVSGRNHYPTDVELACEAAAPALRKGCGAAFTFDDDGRERIAVVYEVAAEPPFDQEAVVADMRRAVARAIDAQPYVVVLIKPRTIPKTSSGKVQRGLCRALFLDGRLDVVGEWSLTGT